MKKMNKERVKKYGEVFTPKWLVDKMLREPDIYQKLKDKDSTFLEPSAGTGNYLVRILESKLSFIQPGNEVQALHCLASIYGIELLEDNVEQARSRIKDTIMQYVSLDKDKLVDFIVKHNIVQGNTLKCTNKRNEPICFFEYLYKSPSQAVLKPFTYVSLVKDKPSKPLKKDTCRLKGNEPVTEEYLKYCNQAINFK